MKGLLSTRLIIWIGVPAALLFAAVIWLASQRSAQKVMAQTEEIAREKARRYAAEIDSQLARVARIPAMHARVLEAETVTDEAKLEAYLRGVVAANPDIYGSCLAFEPGAFTPGKHFYAPYWYRKADGALEFVQLGNPEYNHFKWEWYRRAKEAREAIWTEPYFDDGGGETLMTTCSVPFLRDGEVRGVATIDVALDQLTKETATFKLGASGYAFMVSQQGRFIAHPDAARIMNATIQAESPELGAAMLAGGSGFMRAPDPRSGRPAWIAYEPVPSGGFSLALIYPAEEVMGEAFALRRELIAMGVIGVLALFGALILIARSISRPVVRLAAAAREVAAGHFDQKINTKNATDEVGHLANAFHKMTRDLQMQMEELRYTTIVKERLEGELSAARAIQISLLPKRLPAAADFELDAVVKPAREVGGDFYDFYALDENRFVLLIADVSGKGIPAALFMAVTKTLLKASASSVLDPGEIVSAVNNALCDESDTGMFVTLVYALLNRTTGQLEVCNAGHLPPLLLEADGGITTISAPSGPALGMLRDFEYTSVRTQLHPGETFFLFTDGVTEALDGRRAFYSPERLHKVLREIHAAPVSRITRGVVQDVRMFSGEREQSDDISVLALRWLGLRGGDASAQANAARAML